jgi:hypothetical protein
MNSETNSKESTSKPRDSLEVIKEEPLKASPKKKNMARAGEEEDEKFFKKTLDSNRKLTVGQELME